MLWRVKRLFVGFIKRKVARHTESLTWLANHLTWIYIDSNWNRIGEEIIKHLVHGCGMRLI